MSRFETLTYTLNHQIATITLNRPEVRNALNRQMRSELVTAFHDAGDDPQVRVILLAGAGKGFCAGADLGEPRTGSDAEGFITELMRREYSPLIKAIANAPKPVISVVNGAAAGVGGALAMACDLMVMAEDAYLYSAFGAISLIPDGGSHKFLQSYLGSKKAYEMIAFSQRLSAQQCEAAGMVNRVFPAGSLLQDALTWAAALTEQAPLTLRLSKQILQQTATENLDVCLEQEALLQNITFRSEDFEEGSKAFFEKRKAVFKGQ
ncbi:enoyl-CoA hydratase/isomerase family protein [Aestuariicella hydrocarbonica]|uniref:Enoyl-CoA hydratase/isomerase family protein n=1 Tax=Pseudomaricurvus hydrocarbonicus TaxID=1470433 RepID=A0A9E5MML4_9GAMM|nr:enoyl-CoA hydratase-related protein [Aestuariicella hydrocarbonica]NHO67015.1 enoyl-CoA hydratase/isomerase family protein [Aestuariicella hydrocarbonica]